MTGKDEKSRGIQEEYDRLASVYDKRWSFYVKRTLEETLARMESHTCERLWLDVGCGTGCFSRMLKARNPSAKIIGADISLGMLKIASAKGEQTYINSNAEDIPLKDNTFDAVTSSSSLHHWRKPVDGLKEIYRVLKPGGRIVLTDWCRDYLTCRVMDIILKIYNPSHTRVYSANECRSLMQTAGFENIRIDIYKINWLWGMMTLTASAAGGKKY